MHIVLKILHWWSRAVDMVLLVLLYLLVPFSIITAYGHYRLDRPWKATGFILLACFYLVSALLYVNPTRRWFLMLVGSCLWKVSESSGIGLGRFGPVVFGWMIGSKGVRVE